MLTTNLKDEILVLNIIIINLNHIEKSKLIFLKY